MTDERHGGALIVTNLPFLTPILGLIGLVALAICPFWAMLKTGVAISLPFAGGVFMLLLYDATHRVTRIDAEDGTITLWFSLVSLALFTKETRPLDEVVAFHCEKSFDPRRERDVRTGRRQREVSYWFKVSFENGTRRLGYVLTPDRKAEIAVKLAGVSGKAVHSDTGVTRPYDGSPATGIPLWKSYLVRATPLVALPLALGSALVVTVVGKAVREYEEATELTACEQVLECCMQSDDRRVRAGCAEEITSHSEQDCRELLEFLREEERC